MKLVIEVEWFIEALGLPVSERSLFPTTA